MPSHLPSLGRLSSTHSEGKGNFHIKIVVLGSPRVGKTAIVSQFLYSHFPESYIATVDQLHRAEYEVKGFGPLILDILDTSGSHEFPVMKKLAIESADAFLLVFSLTDSESFEEVRRLRDEIIATKKCKAAEANAATMASVNPNASNNTSPSFTQPHVGPNLTNLVNNRLCHESYNSCLIPQNRGRHHSINPIINNNNYSHNNDRLDNIYFNHGSYLPGINEKVKNSSFNSGTLDRLQTYGYRYEDEENSLHESSFLESVKLPPIVVAANKCDLDSMRVIKRELTETIVTIDWENGYVESSAKDDFNINTIFQQLMVQIGVPYKIGSVIGNPKIRRKSLPAYPTSPALRDKVTPKRNSCAVS
ncbi:ras-like protein rasU [Tetranychus urticae]|uniref:ras-like protein rasU n=1 Tax=Tetranychus urticae TaxID=32264 RepID=UPI00077B8F16|nr:ras-like protein rasU [Tetranychus urticae]